MLGDMGLDDEQDHAGHHQADRWNAHCGFRSSLPGNHQEQMDPICAVG